MSAQMELRSQHLQAKKRSAFLRKALGRKVDLNEFEQVGGMK
jgi:hypothetical protein